MIRILLGNVGSGKTARMVREMCLNQSNKHYFSNIVVKGVKNHTTITADMIIKTKKYIPEGKQKEVVEKNLNVEFWKEAVEKHKDGLCVIIDEAHIVLNPRRSMSKTNVIMNDFLSLIRRVVGQSDNVGELILITQLERRIDVVAKEMATAVHYHICHYVKTCKKCGLSWNETNEDPEKLNSCPNCTNWRLYKHSHIIEAFHFANMEKYMIWYYNKFKTYHRHYNILDIENYFSKYNTLQWDNLISEY